MNDEVMPDQPALTRVDTALVCFVLLAKFLGIPADPSQIAHDRGKGDDPYTLEDLARVAKKLGLIARIRRVDGAAAVRWRGRRGRSTSAGSFPLWSNTAAPCAT